MTSNAPTSILARHANKTTMATKRIRFALKGTPLQQERAIKGIEKRLAREAGVYRRKAKKLEALRTKVEAARQSGEPPKRNLLIDVFCATNDANYYLARLVGAVDFTQDAISRAIFPESPHVMDGAPTVAAEKPVVPTRDPLAEATAIVRSASGEIDWSADPLTDRERRIRAKYLEALTGAHLLSLVFSLRRKGARVASDLQRAHDDESREIKEWCERDRRDAISEAIEAVDAEG